MPEITSFAGMKIEMYFDDHNPPHIHVTYDSHKVMVQIQDSVLMKGELPSKKLKILIGWVAWNEEKLMEMWNTQKIYKLKGME